MPSAPSGSGPRLTIAGAAPLGADRPAPSRREAASAAPLPIYTTRASTLLGDWWLDPVDDHAPAIGVAQIAVLYAIGARPDHLSSGSNSRPATSWRSHAPNDYDVTGLSGTMYRGMGDKLDTTRGQALNVGGYLHLPKGARTITSGPPTTR